MPQARDKIDRQGSVAVEPSRGPTEADLVECSDRVEPDELERRRAMIRLVTEPIRWDEV